MTATEREARMTVDEYLDALGQLGMSSSQAARWLSVTRTTTHRWAKNGPTAPASKLLRLMLALHFSPGYVDRLTGTVARSVHYS